MNQRHIVLMMARRGAKGEDLVPRRKAFIREESMYRLRKEMWEGSHFDKKIVGNGEVLNVSL
jgi:hypothetical protein